MKANEVLKLLKISRPTLTKYVKNGWIKKTDLPSGRYDYDRNSVNELEKKFLSKMFNTFKDTTDTLDFNRLLYAMTHVIIGDSWFYETSVESSNYGAIINFLKMNFNRIIKDGTNDIITEIGVVFLICNEFEEARKYKKYVVTQIGKDNLVEPKIPLKYNVLKDKIDSLEHTNILAIMLFKNLGKI